jgi:hypothetical protein
MKINQENFERILDRLRELPDVVYDANARIRGGLFRDRNRPRMERVYSENDPMKNLFSSYFYRATVQGENYPMAIKMIQTLVRDSDLGDKYAQEMLSSWDKRMGQLYLCNYEVLARKVDADRFLITPKWDILMLRPSNSSEGYI